MKKTIALFIICLMAIMSLTACGGTNATELAELRKQVNSLEARVSELESNVSEEATFEEETTVSKGTTFEEETIVSKETVESSSNQQLLQYMDKQLRSNRPDSWLEVAKCEFATEDHLLAVAKKCATINCYSTNSADKEKQIEIANALSENSATTDAVMAELVNSRFPDVWKAVASSNKSGEKALLAVAKKCATINCYSTNSADKEKQIEIANALSENSATTDAVMAELVNSRFPDVQSIGHQWIEN